MTVACLDTQIIQWGLVQRITNTDVGELVARATDFLRWLDQRRYSVIIPTVVVGEVLLPVPVEAHADALAELSSKWMIVDYDIRAARLFAEMSYGNALRDLQRQIRHGDPHITRNRLKADVMILATARAYGADQLYSHDGDFVTLARRYINAENFLDVEVQMGLPGVGNEPNNQA